MHCQIVVMGRNVLLAVGLSVVLLLSSHFFQLDFEVFFNLLFAFLLIRQETVEQLLANIFDKEKNESAIVSVIQILLTLFETRRPA